MMMEQRCYRALIVSRSEKFIKEIGSLLSVEQFEKSAADSASKARRMLLEQSYDFVIINAPLSDEFGSRLSMDVSTSQGTIAVLFAMSDVYEEMVHKTASHGVFIIKKPSSATVVRQSLSLLISARERLRAVEKKAGKAQSKIEEIRVVNKAKWFLIDNEDMSETEAHRYIEQQAMEAGITKRQAAQIVIDRYL